MALDKGENKKRAVEMLEFLFELHKYSPEASTYNWAELMSTYVTEKAANSYYVGARLLEQVMANNARIADVTLPVAFPKKLTRPLLSIHPGVPHPEQEQRGRRQAVCANSS